jgi:hypothetical protein
MICHTGSKPLCLGKKRLLVPDDQVLALQGGTFERTCIANKGFTGELHDATTQGDLPVQRRCAPTTPSFPTMALSVISPPERATTSEMQESIGKCTDEMVSTISNKNLLGFQVHFSRYGTSAAASPA